ncbi:MAG: PH domain-containing protein [Faecalibacterium sp.]
MNKYQSFAQQGELLTLERFVHEGETVLWKAKPEKKAFIANKICTLLPVALFWLAFDAVLAYVFLTYGAAGQMLVVFVPFLALHLLPVWIWLSNVITAGKNWENTEYMVTDRRIMIKSGVLNQQVINLLYADIQNVSLRVGLIDRMLGVGDIHLQNTSQMGNMYAQNTSQMGHIRLQNTAQSGIAILDVANPEEVANQLQRLVMDIQSDIAYPNAMRPDTNPSYQSAYTGGAWKK